MKAKLLAQSDVKHSVEQVFGARATIGRSQENMVVLKEKAISKNHAAISWDSDAGCYFLEDLGSLNGTELDGVRVESRERLGKLHAIALGGAVELIFLALDLSGEDDPDLPSAVEVDGKTSFDQEIPTLPPDVFDAAAEPGGTRVEKLAVQLPEALGGSARPSEAARSEQVAAATGFFLEIPATGEKHWLHSGGNSVGRLDSADITLKSPDLSRQHATLLVDGDAVLVRDEESRNHTFVGGKQVDGEVPVGVGSVLHFGRLEARLGRSDDDAAAVETRAGRSNGKEQD